MAAIGAVKVGILTWKIIINLKLFLGVEKYLLAKDRSRIYHHLLLIGNPVMSKTDLTRVSNIFRFHGLRDKAIERLVADKLLIVGEWFASRSSNGTITLHERYKKGYPEDNPEDKSRFSRLLAAYGIDHEAYHCSFNERKPFQKLNDQYIPRKLTNKNISSKNWCFSSILAEFISKSTYLRSRIELNEDRITIGQAFLTNKASNNGRFSFGLYKRIKYTVIFYLDPDKSEQIKQHKKRKPNNRHLRSKRLADEVKNIIDSLPSSRRRLPKSVD